MLGCSDIGSAKDYLVIYSFTEPDHFGNLSMQMFDPLQLADLDKVYRTPVSLIWAFH